MKFGFLTNIKPDLSKMPPVSRWLAARTPRLAAGESLTLHHGRIYLLPTVTGMGFALLLALLLLVGLNYDNNLVLFLAFLLAGLGLNALLATWQQLQGLTVTAEAGEPDFAGGQVRYPLRLTAPAPERRLLLRLGDAAEVVVPALSPGTSRRILLTAPARRRGCQRAGLLRIASTHPLGLFRAWSRIDLASGALVWPRPAISQLPLPFEAGGGHGDGVTGSQASEPLDFAGHRPWRRGDSLRAVDWKALAREQGLLTKLFDSGVHQECWLDPRLAPETDPEARLSRLCAWLLEAERRCIPTGLRLPGRLIPPGTGERHRLQCLEAMALCEVDGHD